MIFFTSEMDTHPPPNFLIEFGRITRTIFSTLGGGGATAPPCPPLPAPLNMIQTMLEYHHPPNSTSTLIQRLYTNLFTCLSTDSYRTDLIHVGKGVLQGDCLNPLLFNLIINTFIQHVNIASYRQLGYQFSKYLLPRHWYQFADDAAVITGQQCENQVLLNGFTRWCSWADMQIRVDKCKTFGIKKVGSNAKQVLPKLYVNNNLIPAVRQDEDFVYLGRSYNYEMDNKSHQDQLVELT